MKRELLITIAAFVLSIQSLWAQNTIVVSGSVKFNEPRAKMQIYKQNGGEREVVAEFDLDKDNRFSYKMVVDEPGLYTLDCKRWESVQFWAEDENVEIDFRGVDTAKIKIKNPAYYVIKGGPKNEVINHLNFIMHQNYQGMIKLYNTSYKTKYASADDKKFAEQMFNEFLSADVEARLKLLAQLYSSRTSAVSLLRYLHLERDAQLIQKIESDIAKSNPGYKPLINILNQKREALDNEKKVAIGSPAPLFEYSTPDGKLLGPASFKGKILLIDFWASWCGPCRQEIPHLKEIYKKYKDRGVEFLSVSIDKGKAEWEKALNDENMDWPQILTPNAGREVMNLYQFSGIPFIILLDREGRIVAKYLRGDSTEKEIDKLLEK